MVSTQETLFGERYTQEEFAKEFPSYAYKKYKINTRNDHLMHKVKQFSKLNKSEATQIGQYLTAACRRMMDDEELREQQYVTDLDDIIIFIVERGQEYLKNR